MKVTTHYQAALEETLHLARMAVRKKLDHAAKSRLMRLAIWRRN